MTGDGETRGTKSARIARLLTRCAVLLAAWSCAGPDRDARPPEARPAIAGIVLVTVDGLIAAELSPFGGAVPAPNMERIAGGGFAVDDAWTVCPQTRPALASYLTGLAPDRHGVLDDSMSSLAGGVPTLATALAERGYATAAFPDSNLVSFSSGLLRDFEIVDDPPSAPGGRATWLPVARPAESGATSFETWLDGLPADRRYFAWLHFSGPLVAQMLGVGPDPAAERAEVVRRFDDVLGRILSAMDARDGRERSAIVVAGTLGDVRGGERDLPGPGFSLDERAIRVPLVARLGRMSPGRRVTAAWAPDVAVTLARLGGAELRAVDGRDLREDGSERTTFAWSRAPSDQMGWPALRAARRDGARPRDLPARDPSERSIPPAPQVPLQAVAAFLDSQGIVVRPAPAAGRVVEPAALRREIVAEVWSSRRAVRAGRDDLAATSYRRALELDPDNLTARIGLGELRVANGAADALDVLRPAVERYPGSPEALHWYAHALWLESWREAEVLLEAVQPYLPHDGDVLYDLACARSLAGDVAASERRLRAAIEAGYRAWPHIETDPDLRNLRESGRLARVLREQRR